MAIRVQCNACGGKLDVGQKYAGRSVECPSCGASVRVPVTSDESAPAKAHTLPRREAESPADTQDFSAPNSPHSGEAAADASHATQIPLPGAATPPSPGPRVDVGGFNMGKKRPVDQEEMDLTPMVDMTFLLLIFFMITASFSVQKSMQVPPPTSDKKGAAQEIQSIDDIAESSITVRIDDRNVIFIEDEPLPGSQRLSDALLQKFNAQRNELLLSADEGALHDTVIAVIDAANEIGVQKIRLVAASKD